ncbi:MAG: succinate dehydrogenase assembly factor 2 [Roseinatronobacter sp.]
MTLSSEETRLKMLHMRSWRRGMKEMDLIFGTFADAHLRALSPDDLDAYERLLSENDQDLYLWVTGAQTGPAEHAPIIDRIARAVGVSKNPIYN